MDGGVKSREGEGRERGREGEKRLHRHVRTLSHESRLGSHDALGITSQHITSHGITLQTRSKGTVNVKRRGLLKTIN